MKRLLVTMSAVALVATVCLSTGCGSGKRAEMPTNTQKIGDQSTAGQTPDKPPPLPPGPPK